MTAPSFMISSAALVDIVQRDFVANGCPVPVDYGEDTVTTHNDPPRVVFIPSRRAERFTPPQYIQAAGEMPQTSADWQARGGQNPRAIFTRRNTMQVLVWAWSGTQPDPHRQREADEAQLHMLVNQVLYSLWSVAHGAFEVVGGVKHPTELKTINLGQTYLLEVDFLMPVLAIPYEYGFADSDSRTWDTAEPSAAATVREVDGDGTAIASVTFNSTPET